MEVNLLKGKGKSLLVLANWSGKRQKTTITLDFPVEKAVSVGNGALNVKTENGKSCFAVDLYAGDIIELSF